jgi:hypothetical protein
MQLIKIKGCSDIKVHHQLIRHDGSDHPVEKA